MNKYITTTKYPYSPSLELERTYFRQQLHQSSTRHSNVLQLETILRMYQLKNQQLSIELQRYIAQNKKLKSNKQVNSSIQPQSDYKRYQYQTAHQNHTKLQNNTGPSSHHQSQKFPNEVFTSDIFQKYQQSITQIDNNPQHKSIQKLSRTSQQNQNVIIYPDALSQCRKEGSIDEINTFQRNDTPRRKNKRKQYLSLISKNRQEDRN